MNKVASVWAYKNYWMLNILIEILVKEKNKISKKYTTAGLEMYKGNKFIDYGQICLCLEAVKKLSDSMSDCAKRNLKESEKL